MIYEDLEKAEIVEIMNDQKPVGAKLDEFNSTIITNIKEDIYLMLSALGYGGINEKYQDVVVSNEKNTSSGYWFVNIGENECFRSFTRFPIGSTR